MRRKSRRKTRRKRRKIRRKKKKTRRRRHLRRKRRNRRRKIGGGPPWKTTDFHIDERLKEIIIRAGAAGGWDEDGTYTFRDVYITKFRVLRNPDGPMIHQLRLSLGLLHGAQGIWVSDSDIVNFKRYQPEIEPPPEGH